MNRGRAGFTFVEMVVVLLILVILMSLTASVLGIGRSAARKTSSQAIMRKVETALRQFKTDFKAYPWQAKYPDLSAGEHWTNRLYYQVGTDISDDDRRKVLADMDTAGAQYAYDCSNEPWGPDEHVMVSDHVFRWRRNNGENSYDWWGSPGGDVNPSGIHWDGRNAYNRYIWDYEDRVATCVMLNRMGAERARLLMMIGDVEANGVKMPDVDFGIPDPNHPIDQKHPGRDLSHIPIVPVAQRKSSDKPGWAVDYLQGELERRFIDGETVLDAYRRPLIYICQVQPGVRGTQSRPLGRGITLWNPQWYGLTPIGRKTLDHSDDPDAAGGLDDPSNLMHSDITTYAAPTFELEFELWSAGPDGKFTYLRDDRENRDNIPCDAYNQGIPK